MTRFNHRDWLWLVAAIVVGVAAFIASRRPTNDRPLMLRPTSEEDAKTLEVRYEAAKAEFQFHATRLYGTGPGWSSDEICNAIERFALAAEAREDLESRVKDLADALKYAQEKASSTLDKFEND